MLQQHIRYLTKVRYAIHTYSVLYSIVSFRLKINGYHIQFQFQLFIVSLAHTIVFYKNKTCRQFSYFDLKCKIKLVKNDKIQ